MIQTLKLPLLLSLALLSFAQNGCIYRTQTQGDWGLSCSNPSPRPDFSPGCYLEANFNTCIGNSPLIIGCQAPGLSIQFTNYLSCKNFLPQVPTPNVATALTQGWVNPVGQIGQFAGELVALTLSLKFDECNADFSTCNLLLKDLFLCDNRDPAIFSTAATTAVDTGVVNPDSGIPATTSDDDDDDDDGDDDRRRHAAGQFQNCLPFYGWTIARLYAEAQAVFGGCSTSNTFTANELNDCLALINQEFAYGRAIAANDIFSATACTGVPVIPSTSVSIPVTSSSVQTSSSSIPTSAVLSTTTTILSTTTVVVGTGGDAGAQDRQTIGQSKASFVSLSMLLLPVVALSV